MVISHGFKREKYVSNLCIARERRNKVNLRKTYFGQISGTIREIPSEQYICCIRSKILNESALFSK